VTVDILIIEKKIKIANISVKPTDTVKELKKVFDYLIILNSNNSIINNIK
jgi:hypothetical protein